MPVRLKRHKSFQRAVSRAFVMLELLIAIAAVKIVCAECFFQSPESRALEVSTHGLAVRDEFAADNTANVGKRHACSSLRS